MEDVRILFLVFAIYSFLGWLTESIFCSVPEGKFINRGFLNGPFCPIYGVGAVLVIVTLSPLRNNLLLLFAASVLLTSSVEYATGFLLEKIFHTKYWDYSTHKCNLQGRVCLTNSLLFGVMCLALVYVAHPVLMQLLTPLPSLARSLSALILVLYFIGDTVITVHAILQLNGKLDELQQVLDEIRQRASEATTETVENIRAVLGNLLDEEAKTRLSTLFEQVDRLEAGSKRMQRRLLDAFPDMKSSRSNESLQHLKRVLSERTKGIRKK